VTIRETMTPGFADYLVK